MILEVKMGKKTIRFALTALILSLGFSQPSFAKENISNGKTKKTESQFKNSNRRHFNSKFSSFRENVKSHVTDVHFFRKGLKHRVVVLEKEVGTIKVQITEIQTKISEQNLKIEILQNRIVELSTNVEENANKINALKNEITAINTQIVELREELLGFINQLNNELATQRTDLTNLTTTVSELQQSTQNQINDLLEEIQVLRNEVETNQDMTDQELAEINFQITAMMADIQSLNNELINLQTQYTQLVTQVSSLEETVSNNYAYLEARSWELSGNNLYYNKGKVGIGVANPYSTLQVGGSTSNLLSDPPNMCVGGMCFISVSFSNMVLNQWYTVARHDVHGSHFYVVDISSDSGGIKRFHRLGYATGHPTATIGSFGNDNVMGTDPGLQLQVVSGSFLQVRITNSSYPSNFEFNITMWGNVMRIVE